MGRILAIDYGKKRTGLAVSDPLKIIAGALDTVDTARLMDWLKDYLRREDVEQFVVGLPKQTNGLDSENLSRVRTSVTQLEQTFPGVPVVWWDERYTSVMAHQTMIESGISRKARRDKALVDRIAATIILQSYMESKG